VFYDVLGGREMELREKLLYLALLSVMTLASGCAPAYHCYSGCRVPCKYCAPSPLPYTQYGGCPCHSNAAQRYLAVPLASPGYPEDDQGVNGEGQSESIAPGLDVN
jgi:hypothetical protein